MLKAARALAGLTSVE